MSLAPPPFDQTEFDYRWRQWLNQVYNCVGASAPTSINVDVSGTTTQNASTTSGTEFDFTIPSGVTRIIVGLVDVSTSGASALQINLGDSGGIETTGYVSAINRNAGAQSVTDGFRIVHSSDMNSTDEWNGVIVLQRHNSSDHTWTQSGLVGRETASSNLNSSAGSKSLTGELTTLRFTTDNGTDTFDNGEISVSYDTVDTAVVPSPTSDSLEVFINGTLQNSTSGTSIDFTLPSGVKEFKVALNDVSLSGTAKQRIRLGDSGGIETSGYKGSTWEANTSNSDHGSGIDYAIGNATRTWSGIITFVLMNSSTNLWAYSGTAAYSDSSNSSTVISGSKELSGELTTVRLTTDNGTDTFDNGSVNIQYDNQPLGNNAVQPGQVVQTSFTLNPDQSETASATTMNTTGVTPPQSTQGHEAVTASITPTNANNILCIRALVNVSLSNASAGVTVGALFQDSDSDAIASTYSGRETVTDQFARISIEHWMTAGTTSSTTFACRVGGNATTDVTINGFSTTEYFAGTANTVMSITEYQV